MTVDRLLPSTTGLSGDDGFAAIAEEILALWNTSTITLSSVAGADTITATAAPAMTAGYAVGMKFSFIAAGTNTGAVTMNINTEGAAAVVDDDGNALGAGQIVLGRLYVIEYTSSSNFRLLGSANIQKVTNYQSFTASGTWTKPAGTPDDALVVVKLVGPGGDGATGGGGGGGGGSCRTGIFRAAELASTVAVTVPTGGATSGPATFGSHLTAYPGGDGGENAASGGASGAGGGGLLGAGSDGLNGQVAVNKAGGAGGRLGGGIGGTGNGQDSADGGDGGDGEMESGGGGGGGAADPSTNFNGGDGGAAVDGGGGGGGSGAGTGTDGAGGESLTSGNGGAVGQDGAAPGGGGGAEGGAGARGGCEVRTIG